MKSRTAGLAFFIFALVSIYVFMKKKEFYYLLIFFENLVAGFCFFYRTEATSKAGLLATLASYVCMLIPMCYFKSVTSLGPQQEFMSGVLLIVGVTIVTLVTLDLGKSNGIRPAKREVVKCGLYRFFNHPMYFGHSISQLSFIIKNPLNIYIYPFSILLFVYRARIENRLLRSAD
ncbi:MAG: methyltransferase family protein [Bacteriovoracaceae bacterium]